ncbi:Aldo/keto reductase [Athelia psychrophila]|uniref:Aldo/keto reductase n=1 Tax=Athelia psychrophila TaxID=1759441 RepID=A0A166X3X2_9AGAM|nr:Aldo/keto reductase [Fibularhizoctonia sp. CBS 109695]
MAVTMIYGTAWKKHETTRLVVQAVLIGFRAIDTACQLKHYREDLVGAALVELSTKHDIKREDLFLQTKFTTMRGQDANMPLPYNPADSIPDQIKSSFQKSLSNLHTGYLDSYILHSPLDTVEDTLEAWRVLMDLQDQGKVRKIGVSNTYDVAILERLATARMVQVVQNRWHEGNHWDPAVFKYCKANGIQYQSFWTLSGSPRLLKSPALLALSRDANCTPPQALFRFAQLQGITPLCGTTDESHMKEGVAVAGITFGESVRDDVVSLQHLVMGDGR